MRRARCFATLILIGATPLSAQRFAALDDAVREGITDGIYPGAVLVIGRGDSVLYSKGYGRFTWSPTAPTPDPAKTLWDLASISKVVATTSSAAVLVDEGRLNLDATVGSYLPEFKGRGKEAVTVRMLLDHTSGMPSYDRLWLNARTPADARAHLFAIQLERKPGERAKYSDLNAMLTGLIVERISGQPLDVFAESAVFAPFGMHATSYRPAVADRTAAMPTSTYRGKPVAGVVNDANARILGGVSGHAGLFSTGLDLARFAQSWLRNTTIKAAPWLAKSTLLEFFHRSAHSGSRALGWDTPDSPGGPSLFGRCATASTVGHTGWTGTELWLDPAQDIFVIFLTNRSYAPRAPEASFKQLKEVRSKVSDAARRALGKCG